MQLPQLRLFSQL